MSNVFDVEELRAKRVRHGQTQYLVKWLDFDEAHNTWEPEQNILAPGLIAKLEQRTAPWVWEFYVSDKDATKDVGWHAFEDDQGVMLSASYDEWLKADNPTTNCFSFSRTISANKAPYHYTLDFEHMLQRNETHQAHTVRQLRRR